MSNFKSKNCPTCGSKKISSYEGKTKCKNCGYLHIDTEALEVKIEEANE